MTSLCRYCAYEQSDCKGNKDLEKLKCEYYKKRPVQNVKQLAERVAELEIKLKDSVQVVRCKDCLMLNTDDRRMGKVWCSWLTMFVYENDFCSNGERREE